MLSTTGEGGFQKYFFSLIKSRGTRNESKARSTGKLEARISHLSVFPALSVVSGPW